MIRRGLPLATLAAVCFALASTAWAAWDQGWTYDEPVHLAWTERFLDTRVAERVSQDRYDSKQPIMLPNVLLRRGGRALGIESIAATRFLARRFGHVGGDGQCQAQPMSDGDVAWYRLAPGRHALGVVEIPNRRAWLPYCFEGTWLVRGRSASLGLRRTRFSGPTPPAPGATTPRSSSPPPPPAG